MDFKADRSDPNLAIQCNKYRRYTIWRFVMGVGEEGDMASPKILSKKMKVSIFYTAANKENIFPSH